MTGRKHFLINRFFVVDVLSPARLDHVRYD